MALYNLLSCKGFIEDTVTSVTLNTGPCMQGRFILVILFFLNAFLRKWGGEEIGIGYNFWAGLGGAFLGFLIPLTIFGDIKMSFMLGIGAMILGGYGFGALFGGGGEDDYGD